MRILMTGLFLTLAACNTVEGVGRDISGGAQRVGSWF
ncbi:entericidin EcnA/B family protein [Halodurantibacterium flavum]|uniref:Entericidin EcnA/B family protein n=1 Tax=Halodurantibacterium flavum TaxID=1382802 RepID=A0ABW4S2X8_9RHOB